MRGLKTQESEKFIKFHELIQTAACERGMVWFAFAGEGNDFETEEMEGEDVSGWLIPEKMADEFEKIWVVDHADSALEGWANFFVWVKWVKKDNGTIGIEFME